MKQRRDGPDDLRKSVHHRLLDRRLEENRVVQPRQAVEQGGRRLEKRRVRAQVPVLVEPDIDPRYLRLGL